MSKFVIFNYDDDGNEIDHRVFSGDKPEKTYKDHVDHYGDRADDWRKLDNQEVG